MDGSRLALIFTVCGYGSYFLHCVDDSSCGSCASCGSGFVNVCMAVVLTVCSFMSVISTVCVAMGLTVYGFIAAVLTSV